VRNSRGLKPMLDAKAIGEIQVWRLRHPMPVEMFEDNRKGARVASFRTRDFGRHGFACLILVT